MRRSRQTRQLLADRALGQPQLVELLEMHPKLRTGSEPVAETQRCVGGNPALTIENSGDPVDWDLNLTRKFGCRQAELTELFRKVFSGMNRAARHDKTFNGSRRSRRQLARAIPAAR